MAKIQTSRVLKQYGVWCVTTWGVECSERYYPISKSRVHEQDWERHLQMKNWMDAAQLLNFTMALNDARERFPKKTRRATAAAGGGK